MSNTAYTFLAAFFRDAPSEQFIELFFIHPDDQHKPKLVSEFVQVGDKVRLSAALERAAALNAEGYGCYFGVCPRASDLTQPGIAARGSEADVDTMLGFWTELDSVKEGRLPADDLAKMQQAQPLPSVCVLSGGGVHAYWLFDKPYTLTTDSRKQVKSALRGLGAVLGGDLSVAEFARILRIPGFTNTKAGRENALVEFIPSPERRRYTLDQLLPFAPPDEPRPVYTPQINREADDEVSVAQAALDALDPSRLDNYEDWLAVGLSLRQLGATGLALWENWSARSPKFKSHDCSSRFWKFAGRKGLGSLFYMADMDAGPGWRPKSRRLERPGLNVPNAIDKAIDQSWDNGLPIGVRAALNLYAYPAVAPTIELAFEGIAKGFVCEDAPITFDCLKHISKKLNRGLSDQTIRSGLNQGVGQFLVVMSDLSISIGDESISSTDLDIRDVTTKNCDPCRNPFGAGRNPTLYKLLPRKEIVRALARLAVAPIIRAAFPPDSGVVAPILSEFLAALGRSDAEQLGRDLNDKWKEAIEAQPGFADAIAKARREYDRFVFSLSDPTIAPIPSDRQYKNHTGYMAACARALIEMHNGEMQYSRGGLCKKLGCTERSLKSILDRAGIVMVKDQYAERQIKNTAALKAIPAKYDREMGGFPEYVKSSGKTDSIKFGARGMLPFVEAELAAGATVTVLYHQANRQVIKRLSWAILVFIQSLLAMLIELMTPPPVQQALIPEPEVEPVDLPEKPAGFVVPFAIKRYLRQQRIRHMLPIWYGYLRTLKGTWDEQWITNFANGFTSWLIEPDRATDRATGEVTEPSIQLAFDAILAHSLTAEPEPETLPADPVLTWIKTELGGTITKVIETGSVTAPPASESMEDHQPWKSLAEGQSDLSITSALSLDAPSRKALQPQATSFSGWLFGMSHCLLPICERLSESILNIRPTIRVLM